MRVAYLNSEYPSLSHTFIEREVRALRRAGAEVTTFSVRPARGSALLGSAHAEAARGTRSILGSRPSLMVSLARALLTHPVALVRALAHGQRLSPPGLRARLWHVAYAIEGVRLAHMLARDNLTHVHVHMANNAAAIAMLACAYAPRLSYSLSIHGSAEFFHVDTWTLAPKAENARFVRCISDFCRAQVMTWTTPSRWEDFHVVRCGVDVERFRPGARPAHPVSPHAGENTEDQPLRLLTIGRLHPIKGYDVLLSACAQLMAEGVRYHLDMVGDGPMGDHLRDQVARLNLCDRVTMHGAVSPDDIGRFLANADAMVVSSFMEGVPVVLMEAMACGLAVVATRVGGIPELVEDGVSGMLCDAGSSTSLAGAIASLARDPARLSAMGARGREVVAARYEIGRCGREMLDLLTRYLNDRVVVGVEGQEGGREPSQAGTDARSGQGAALAAGGRA